MRNAKRTLFLAALIAMVGVSAGVMALDTYVSISPNTGSIDDIPTAHKKILTISGTNLNLVTGGARLLNIGDGTTVVGLNNVGLSAGNDEKYVTINSTTKAGRYKLQVDIGAGFVDALTVPANPLSVIVFTLVKENNNLQVQVKMTLQARADICWALGTGGLAAPIANADDAAVPFIEGDIKLFTWVVRDGNLSDPIAATASNYFIDLNGTYSSSDNQNGNKSLLIRNISKTGNAISLSAMATDTVNWKLAGAVTTDKFSLSCNPDLAGAVPLSHVSAVVLPSLAKSTIATPVTTSLVLTMSTPPDVTAGAGAVQTSTVQFTATAL